MRTDGPSDHHNRSNVQHHDVTPPRTLLAFEPGCPHRQRAEEWFARAQVTPERIVELGSYHAILGCAVVCADSEQEAERLATTIDLNWVRRACGEYLPLASPEEAAAYPYSPIDRERIKARRARLFVGTPARVREQLAPLLAATKADELMVTTMIHDHTARRRSYELLAQAFELHGT